jgi:hypothetical protein
MEVSKMAKKIETTSLELDNGSSIEVSGTEQEISEASFYVPNWKAGNLPHKSISQAFMKAMAKVDKDVIVGNYEGKPVYDVEKVWDKVFETTIDTLGLEIEKSVATSRTGAKKKLDAIMSALSPEVVAQLKAQGLI